MKLGLMTIKLLSLALLLLNQKREASLMLPASVKGCSWIKKKELAKVNLEFKNSIQENISKYNDISSSQVAQQIVFKLCLVLKGEIKMDKFTKKTC